MKDSNINLLAGFAAGSMGLFVGYPFDVLKTYSQIHQHHSLLSSCRHIYNSYGLWGFFKGISAPLSLRSVIKTLNFVTYEKVLNSHFMGERQKFLRMIVAGFISGLVSTVIVCPVDLIKISNQKGYQISQMIRRRGPVYLLTGLKETMIKETLFHGISFPLYDYCKHIGIPFAGGIAGILPWILIYPIDVMKTIKQSPIKGGFGFGNLPQQQHLVITTVAQLWEKKGVRGFYNGFYTSMLRAFPMHLVTFYVYDWVRKAL